MSRLIVPLPTVEMSMSRRILARGSDRAGTLNQRTVSDSVKVLVTEIGIVAVYRETGVLIGVQAVVRLVERGRVARGIDAERGRGGQRRVGVCEPS